MNIPTLTWHGCYDGRWDGLIVPEAFAHPAKFARGLIERIVTHGLRAGWWREGDTLGDPFGGVALGGVIAGYHGLNWVGVELEARFVELGNRNLALHGPKWMVLGAASRVTLLQGDSRRFADVVRAAGIITSPPYNLPFSQDHNGSKGGRHGTAPSEAGAFVQYGVADGQIEGLPTGSVEAVLTSPPYAETLNHGGGPDTKHDLLQGGKSLLGIKDGYGNAEGQIGHLREGNLDAVLTSPPFGIDQPCASQTRAKKDYHAFTRGDGTKRDHQMQAEGNIAALASGSAGETYWQAMHAVYGQCLAALRPGGVMAVVVKDYVKDKARVPLCDQTLRLLEALGFRPVCRIHAMLVKERRHAGLFGEHVERTERKSFFRRLAEKKGSPAIDWEEVIVVRAPLEHDPPIASSAPSAYLSGLLDKAGAHAPGKAPGAPSRGGKGGR